MMWRTSSDQVLHYRAWEDEVIVYNALSGDTHLLGLAAAQTLSTLQKLPVNIQDLVQKLASLWQAEPDEQMQQEVAEILADLTSLSLITPSEL